MTIGSISNYFTKQPRWAIVLLALAPALTILLPWDFGTDSTTFRAFIRTNMLGITIVEFLFVFVAMTRGFSLFTALRDLPRLAIAGLAMLSIGTLWTTILVAEFPIMAVIGIIKFIAHGLFGLAIAQQISSWALTERMQIWPAIGLGVVGFCLLWAANILFFNPVGNDWLRLVPSLPHVRWAGLYAFSCFCVGIAFIKVNSDNKYNWPILAIGIFFGSLGLAIAFWTGTRAAVLAVLIAVSVSLYFVPTRRQLVILTVASIIIGLAFAAMLPIVNPVYGIGRIIGAVLPAIDGEDISSGRLQIWTEMLDKIYRRPIMGWGIDQFRYSFSEGEFFARHPHNGVMQLIYSSGIWGVCAATLMAIAFVRAIPSKIDQPYQFAAIAYLVGMTMYGVYDGPFYFTYPIMIWLVAAACLVAPSQPRPASDT
jgi:O-antigen ligase